MQVNEKRCFGCEACIPYCPVEAISLGSNQIAKIDEGICVECGNCQRAAQDICGALYRPEQSLRWPRVLRAALSDPAFVSPLPHVTRRGLQVGEKTNDVEGYYGHGEFGVKVELGRPNSGVSFREVEKLTKALAQIGIPFDRALPTTCLMDDPKQGTFPEDVLNQRALTVFVSFKTDEVGLDLALDVISKLCQSLDTLSVITLVRKVGRGESLLPVSTLDKFDYSIRPNGKVNLGLGRPAFVFSPRRT